MFVRSWGLKHGGWYRILLEERRGAVKVSGREIPIRSVRMRSERLKDAVDRACLAKYSTPGSVEYARGLGRARCRAMTMELAPL